MIDQKSVIYEDLRYLEKYSQKLKQLHIKSCLLTVEHIGESFNCTIFKDSILHCIALKGQSFSPSLSVSFKNNNIIYFRTLEDLGVILEDIGVCLEDTGASPFNEECLEAAGFTLHCTIDYIILLKTKRRLTSEEKKEICRIESEVCETVKKSSLHLRNIERDFLIDKYNELLTKMKYNSNYKLQDLCSFIRKKEKLSSVPVYFHSENVLECDIDEIKRNSHKLSDCILNTDSIQYINKIKYKFSEAIESGKPISGYERGSEFTTYFVLIPIIRKTEVPNRAKSVLFIYSNNPLKCQSLECIIEYIDMFVSYAMSEKKLKEIIAVQKEVLNIPMILNTNKISGYEDFKTRFRSFVSIRMSKIGEVTRAYSVSLRLYDPIGQKLVLFAQNIEEHCKNSKKIDEIYVKNYSRSVDSFTYLVGSNHGYVYLPNINAPIPEKYSKDGLLSPLKCRKDSVSEICFPLISGKVPFGVLNIEAPIKNAFNEDIDYLVGIKESIEAYYSNLLHANDLQWVRSQINTYENLHEIKNEIDMNLFDEKTSERLNKMLSFISLPFNEQEIDYVELEKQNIKDKMEAWINYIYSPLTQEKRDEICNRIKYKLDKDVELPSDLIENVVVVILKNLVRNIVSHGKEELDGILISTSPFFKIGDLDYLRIYMRTFGLLGPEIIDKIGIVPIYNQLSEKPHYGMFLIGMMTRILGGTMQVSRDSKKGFGVIELRIPIHWGVVNE